MDKQISRRDFLRSSAATGLTLMLPSFTTGAGVTLQNLTSTAAPVYTTWMDIYRQQWTWDKVVRSTHFLNCWYQAACSWDVYVKDGVVIREEQAADYPQVNADVPDFNPRGCQKGACYSERMYDPTRIHHPIRRVGERGGGRWERVSWDEALDDLADTYIDIALEEGVDRLVIDQGTNVSFGVVNAGFGRFGLLTQATLLDPNSEIGDQHRGAFETFGKMIGERSADDFFNSDLILIWGCNPIYTQIPNAHFFTEARYNGTRLIAISPDYNASAIKADQWIPVNSGTDAALALAVCHVLIKEGLVVESFVEEQTDLPLLVRSDNGAFLVAADIEDGGTSNQYLVLDKVTREIRAMPTDSLKLGDIKPDLYTRRTIRLLDGTETEVCSVYSLLVDRLEDNTPEEAYKTCGVSPDVIRQLARDIASAKAVANVTSSTISKYYHGNLTERAMILLFCLTGNMGRKGAGYSAFPGLTQEGTEKFASVRDLDNLPQFMEKVYPLIEEWKNAGATDELIAYELARLAYKPGTGLPIFASSSLFWAVHGGVMNLAKQSWDPFLKRPIREHVENAVKLGWQPLQPAMDREPRMMITVSGNPLRRVRGSHKLLDTLWPKLRKIVVCDFRMSSTALQADYVLPVASYYERTDHRYATPLMPYLHVGEAATKPYANSKSDWTIFALLTKHIQKRARARKIGPIRSIHGVEVQLQNLYDDFTLNGQFGENDEDKVAKKLLELSSTFDEVDWEAFKKKGYMRFKRVGTGATSIGNMCDIPENDTVTHFTYHVQGKVPWPTETRRIQFYLDHPLYAEHDELLPRYKKPPAIGGNYPLMLTGGHTRWSIHSIWRDDRLMLRLHRPEPYILLSISDAKERGIKEGDRVRIRNDVGQFQVVAKIAPSVRPGQTIMYHAWENYQFKGGNYRQVTPSPLNPVETAGGHPHLRANALTGQCGNFDRDTRIEVELITESGEV